MHSRVLGVLLLLYGLVCGERCSGVPKRTSSGALCASITIYWDCNRGACQNGYPAPHDMSDPNSTCYTAPVYVSYTAALNAANLNPTDPSATDCLQHKIQNCDSCWRLCNVDTQVCITTKVTNRCGDGYDPHNPRRDSCNQLISSSACKENLSACKSDKYNLNKGNYSAHFDLMDLVGQIRPLTPDERRYQFPGADKSRYYVPPKDSLHWKTTWVGLISEEGGTEVTFEKVDCKEWIVRGNASLVPSGCSTKPHAVCKHHPVAPPASPGPICCSSSLYRIGGSSQYNCGNLPDTDVKYCCPTELPYCRSGDPGNNYFAYCDKEVPHSLPPSSPYHCFQEFSAVKCEVQNKTGR